MEQSPWIETILRLNERMGSTAKILDIQTDSVVGKGENYCSVLTRYNLKIVLASGKIVRRSVITKEPPTSDVRSKMNKDFGIFRREISIYGQILPMMEDLIEEMSIKEDTLWGKCYHSTDQKIVLQDLKESGFTMANRKQGLNLEHCQLVATGLAKFHVMSIILRERGLISPENYQCSFMMSSFMEQVGAVYDQAFLRIASLIETSWEPEWHPYSKKLLSISGKIIQTMREVKRLDKFNVLNHGDCWTNNIMFKYASHLTSPVSIKLLDYQNSFFGSYGFDLSYFFATSAAPDVINHHVDEVLEAYRRSLTKSISSFKDNTLSIPSLEDIKCCMGLFSHLMLGVACMSLPLMLADSEDIPETEDLFESMENQKDFNVGVNSYKNKPYETKLKSLLKWCDKLNAFK